MTIEPKQNCCCSFIRCVLPCFFDKKPKVAAVATRVYESKSLTRHENASGKVLKNRHVKLLSTDMVSIRQVLHERGKSQTSQTSQG